MKYRKEEYLNKKIKIKPKTAILILYYGVHFKIFISCNNFFVCVCV